LWERALVGAGLPANIACGTAAFAGKPAPTGLPLPESALLAVADLLAIFAQVLGHAARAFAAGAVAGYGVVDKLRVGEAELGHQFLEGRKALLATQARVARLFLGDRGHAALLVVMAGIHQRVIGQREQLAAHAVVERARVAVLEVGAAAALDQQRVAGKHTLA